MLWDYGRMLRGRDQTEAIRVLSELVAQEPARTDARMELAADQLTAKDPGAALETLKPVKKVTPEEAPRLFAIMAHAQLDLKQWNDAKESAGRLEKSARTEEDKLQADQILKYLETRGSEAEPGRPTLQRKSISGAFVLFDCSGKAPRVVLETEEGKKVFLVDDPKKVVGATMEFTCGAQNKDRVRVDYIPANQAGVDGLVRGIRVEP
jgi:hypothetical protein